MYFSSFTPFLGILILASVGCTGGVPTSGAGQTIGGPPLEANTAEYSAVDDPFADPDWWKSDPQYRDPYWTFNVRRDARSGPDLSELKIDAYQLLDLMREGGHVRACSGLESIPDATMDEFWNVVGDPTQHTRWQMVASFFGIFRREKDVPLLKNFIKQHLESARFALQSDGAKYSSQFHSGVVRSAVHALGRLLLQHKELGNEAAFSAALTEMNSCASKGYWTEYLPSDAGNSRAAYDFDMLHLYCIFFVALTKEEDLALAWIEHLKHATPVEDQPKNFRELRRMILQWNTLHSVIGSHYEIQKRAINICSASWLE